MNSIILMILLQINIIYCQEKFKTSFINAENNDIDNATYIIRTRDGALNLEISFINNVTFKNDNINRLKTHFLITKREEDTYNNIIYYYIQINNLKKKLSSTKEGKNLYILNDMEDNDDLALWSILPKINSNNQLVYTVQNKYNKRFWEYDSLDIQHNLKLSKTNDMNSLNINNEFLFIRLYRESDKFESQILKEEPIDVLITYVDLSDKNYVSIIPRIKKDQDNKELKYSIRSILENIPWIRKIFILMPNEKVSYFKPVEEIKEKIIYVKDRDYLGFDSASSPTLQFNLHKMKKFGLSENFILMDDDNFIAKPLQKSDFFYEENGKVYPCLITSDYYEIDKTKKNQQLLSFLSKTDSNKAHSTNNFYVQQIKSLLLMYDIFGDDDKRYGKKLIEPSFTHNATPLKLSDIEELYNYIHKYYIFANETLAALARSVNSLQMQTTYTAYVKNQYDRKVSIVSSAFYDLSQVNLMQSNNKTLFVINTGLSNYRQELFIKERMILNSLFPHKTKYELLIYDDIDLIVIDKEKKLINKKFALKFSSYKKNKSVILHKLSEEINKLINIFKKNKDSNKNEMTVNYTDILSEEINYLKNESQNLVYINYILFLFIIVFIGYNYLYYYLYYSFSNCNKTKRRKRRYKDYVRL